MEEGARRAVIAAQSQSVKRALEQVEAKRSASRRRYSFGVIALLLLLLGAFRVSGVSAPLLQAKEMASAASTPLTAADAAVRAPRVHPGNTAANGTRMRR